MPQITCLISLRVESSIISIYSNIVENIIRKFTDVKWKKCRTQNGALRNTSINWIFLWRIPIQIHLKSSITELRRNKAKYLARNSIRLNFAKTTSMLNPVKSIRCIKCYSWSSPKSFYQIQLSENLQLTDKTWNHTEDQGKKPHFSRWSTSLLSTCFSKTLLNTERRLTGR